MNKFTIKIGKTEPTNLDNIIERLEKAILEMEPTDEGYAHMADQLKKLTEIRKSEKTAKRVSPDVWANIAGSLAGILLVMNHERAHVITTKAMGTFLRSIR